MSTRLKNVRQAALVACIATVLGTLIPFYNAAYQVLDLEVKIGKFAVITVIVAECLFATIVPLFYFALSRNEGDLLVPYKMRWIVGAAAMVALALALLLIPGWVASFQRESVLETAGRRWSLGDTSNVLAEIELFADILLFVALFRLAGDAYKRDVPVSNLLRVMTKIAVIAGGVVAVGCVVGIASTPWVYFYARDRGFTTTFSQLALDRFRTALGVIYAFTAPYVVWSANRLPRHKAADAQTSSGLF